MHLAISPVLLGSGEALFAGLDLPALGYRGGAGGESATHVVVTSLTARRFHWNLFDINCGFASADIVARPLCSWYVLIIQTPSALSSGSVFSCVPNSLISVLRRPRRTGCSSRYSRTDAAAQLARTAQQLGIRHRLNARVFAPERFHVSLLGFGAHAGLPPDLVAGAAEAAAAISQPRRSK